MFVETSVILNYRVCDIDAQCLPLQALFESPQVCVLGKGYGITSPTNPKVGMLAINNRKQGFSLLTKHMAHTKGLRDGLWQHY